MRERYYKITTVLVFCIFCSTFKSTDEKGDRVVTCPKRILSHQVIEQILLNDYLDTIQKLEILNESQTCVSDSFPTAELEQTNRIEWP